MQIIHPILYLDSWSFTHRPALLEWQNFLRWLVSPHAFHRLLLQKTLSVIETEVFKLPPATTNLLQSLLLVLLSSGIIALTAQKISSRSTALLAWLTANAILFNHWQSENFWWEFQTPWFFINMLTLLCMVLLLRVATRRETGRTTRLDVLFFSLVPWIAIYSSGQGIALAMALVFVCLWISHRLALVTTLSTLAALGIYYFGLPYSSPTKSGFDLKFLLVLLSGSSWGGMVILSLGLLALLGLQAYRLRRTGISWREHSGVLAALALPAGYAVLFAGLTTLARSQQGLAMATASRYVTPLIMLPISGILLSAWLNQSKIGSARRRTLTAIVPAVLYFLAMVAPPSNSLSPYELKFARSWDDAIAYRQTLEQGFRCSALQSQRLLAGKPLPPASACETVDGAAGEAIKYLTGRKALKPQGWHQQLLANPSS